MTSPRRIYLDQAATSWPKLPAAVDAAAEFIRQCGATSGRGVYASAQAADRWVTSARHNLARLVHASDATDVAFCSSGTHALNAALHGLLRPGHRVLTTAIEHNSVLRPLEQWRQRQGVQLTIAPCDERGLVEMPELLAEDRFDLVVVSHGSNVTGRIQALSAWSELASRAGAVLIVDASQTLGYVPIDMQREGVDVLVSAGHKGLEALSGTGVLIADKRLQPQFQPLMWGGTGSFSEQLDFQPGWPQSIEVGNLNLPAIVSMSVAAEHWLAHEQELGAWRGRVSHLSRLCDNGFRWINCWLLAMMTRSTICQWSVSCLPFGMFTKRRRYSMRTLESRFALASTAPRWCITTLARSSRAEHCESAWATIHRLATLMRPLTPSSRCSVPNLLPLNL